MRTRRLLWAHGLRKGMHTLNMGVPESVRRVRLRTVMRGAIVDGGQGRMGMMMGRW